MTHRVSAVRIEGNVNIDDLQWNRKQKFQVGRLEWRDDMWCVLTVQLSFPL